MPPAFVGCGSGRSACPVEGFGWDSRLRGGCAGVWLSMCFTVSYYKQMIILVKGYKPTITIRLPYGLPTIANERMF